MLATRLHAVCPSEEVSAAYRRVADCYADQGYVEHAIDAVRAGWRTGSRLRLIERQVAVLQNSEAGGSS
jgi:hypothetical protein